MNEWGKQILINCGWKEGCGLGVNQDGDKEPVVTRLKLDRFQSIAHNSSSLTIGARACVGDKNGRHILVEEAGTMLNSTTAAPKRLKLRTTPKPWDGNPLSPCCRFNSSHKVRICHGIVSMNCVADVDEKVVITRKKMSLQSQKFQDTAT
mmetsp:Transcript_18460/g.50974  ORF Transcript_18460/g.50974 Transcript_18460/m.50974 type:complete len:150 (+) Transcript_18460:609-1058(+)